MKKTIFVLLATSILGGCSSEDVINDMQGKAITFSEEVAEIGKRAVVNDPSYGENKKVEAFQVWGTVTGNAGSANIYNGAWVTRNGAVDGEPFTCAQQEFWIPSSTYNFVAIAHASSVTFANGLPNTIYYEADTNGANDLLYAAPVTVGTTVNAVPNTNDVNAKGCVAFTFIHLLSKIHFSFQVTAGSSQNITEIQVTGHFTEGTYTIGTQTWDAQGSATTPLNFGGAANVGTTPVTSTNACLIIPGNQKLAISFKQDGELVTKPLEYTFEANKEYNILVTLEGGSAITFTINSLEDWGEENDIPLNP